MPTPVPRPDFEALMQAISFVKWSSKIDKQSLPGINEARKELLSAWHEGRLQIHPSKD